MGIRMIEGEPRGRGRRIAVVAARFNDLIGKRLLKGALEALAKEGVRTDDIAVTWVPGAWEIPVVARRFAESGRCDGVIALGAVIRGETAHHEHIGREAAAGLRSITDDTGIPVAFGVLTTDTLEQALARCGAREDNKGCEAALHLLETLSVLEKIRKPDPPPRRRSASSRQGKHSAR